MTTCDKEQYLAGIRCADVKIESWLWIFGLKEAKIRVKTEQKKLVKTAIPLYTLAPMTCGMIDRFEEFLRP